MLTDQDRSLVDQVEQAQPLAPDARARIDAIVTAAIPRSAGAFTCGSGPLSTDAVMEAAGAILPGWSVKVKGRAAPHKGQWVCTLRKSGDLDSDEVIGIGQSDLLAHAVLAALLTVVLAGTRIP